MGSYLHAFLHIPYTSLHRPYTENVKRLTGLTVMYDRDRNENEKIINRLECLNDKFQEILDVLQMFLGSQNQSNELLRKLLDSNLRGLENQDYARKIADENRVIAMKLIPIFEGKENA